MIEQVYVTAIEPVTLKLRVSVSASPSAYIKHSCRGEGALLVLICVWDDKLATVGGIGESFGERSRGRQRSQFISPGTCRKSQRPCFIRARRERLRVSVHKLEAGGDRGGVRKSRQVMK